MIFNTHNPKSLSSDIVRRGEDYMKNYFASRYGAIKDVDFGPILEKIVIGDKAAEDG